MSPMIFPDFEEIPRNQRVSKNGHILVSYRGCGLPKLWVRIKGLWRSAGAVPEMGHPLPRLGLGMGAQEVTGRPRFSGPRRISLEFCQNRRQPTIA